MGNIYSKYLSLNESKSADGSKKKTIKEWRRNISGYSEISDEEVKKYQSELNESKGDIITIEKEFENRVGLEFDEVVEDIRSSNKGWEFFCGSYTDEVDSLVSLIEDLISDGEIGKYEVTLNYGKGRTCWIYLDKVEDDDWDDEELEESSRKKSRFYKKRLGEKDGILESRKIRIIGKKLCEDIAKAKDFDEALDILRDAIVSMGDGIGAEIDSLWVANGEDGKIVLDFKDNNNPKNVDMFKKALEGYNFIDKVDKKSDDRLIIYFKDEFKERFDESRDGMRKKISLFKSRNNTIKESSKRKSFKEYKKLNEAHDCKVLRISGLKPFLKKAFKELDVDESSETYYAKQDLGVRVSKKKNIRGDIFLRAVFFSDEGDVLIDAEDYDDLIYYMDNQYCEELNWLI